MAAKRSLVKLVIWASPTVDIYITALFLIVNVISDSIKNGVKNHSSYFHPAFPAHHLYMWSHDIHNCIKDFLYPFFSDLRLRGENMGGGGSCGAEKFGGLDLPAARSLLMHYVSVRKLVHLYLPYSSSNLTDLISL